MNKNIQEVVFVKKTSVIVISSILTLAVVASFAVGPMVNTQAKTPVPPTQTPAHPGLTMMRNTPVASAIEEYHAIMTQGKLVTLSGKITDIIYGNGKLPTEITITTTTGDSVEILLGPIWMFNAKELVLNTTVEVKGKELNSKMVAYSVTFNNNQLVQLRNNEGLPLWAGMSRNNNRQKMNFNDIKQRIENYLHNHRGQQPRNGNGNGYRQPQQQQR
jgi:hypothetical protein